MKILFVGYNLSMGGIQRALIHTLHELVKEEENEIDLFLFSITGELAREIPREVNIVKSHYLLSLTATSFKGVIKNGNLLDKIMRLLLTILVRLLRPNNYFKMLFLLQRGLKNYDVAISYYNDTPKGYFNRGSNQFVIENASATKKVGWIHTDPIKAKFSREKNLKTYRGFDSIVHVSKAGKEKFDELIPEYKYKSTVVHNFIPYDAINERANEYMPKFKKEITNFVTVARIDNVSKRIDRIVEVINMLKKGGYRNFKWWIVGDGPDREKNYALAEKYEVIGLIEFIGEKANPFPYMKHADAFILASDFEGYPMVVGEALALGTPVVTTAYASVSEQIVNSVGGIIVDVDTNELFKVLKSILDDSSILSILKDELQENRGNNEIALQQLRDLLHGT